MTERIAYTPFGVLLDAVEHDTPFLFNGQYGVMTDENNLYHLRARFYSPELRRFVNQDILLGDIAEGQSLNRYAFVRGDPVKYLDPFGLDRLCWGGMRREPCPEQPHVYRCVKDDRVPEKVCASSECDAWDATNSEYSDGPYPYLGGGVFADLHFLLFSISGEHSVIRANNKTCRFVTYCSGLGPEVYGGTGITIPLGFQWVI